MNKFLSVLAIAFVSMACLSGAAPLSKPAPLDFHVYCRELPELMIASAYAKDKHIQMALGEHDRTLMFLHLAMAMGLEEFMQELENTKCLES